jgi:hypothetical protein
MAITHLAVDDSVLAQLAMSLSHCSNMIDIWLSLENIRRSSLSNVPTPPNLIELSSLAL